MEFFVNIWERLIFGLWSDNTRSDYQLEQNCNHHDWAFPFAIRYGFHCLLIRKKNEYTFVRMFHFDDDNFKQLPLNVEPECQTKNALVRSEPGKFVLTSAEYENNTDKIYRLVPRSDDVWLVTVTKCGNT